MTWGYVEISCEMTTDPRSPGMMDNKRDHPLDEGGLTEEG